MSAEEIIRRLTMIARANLGRFITLDDNGQPTIVLNKVTEAQLYGLVDVTVEVIETKRGRGTEPYALIGPVRICAGGEE